MKKTIKQPKFDDWISVDERLPQDNELVLVCENGEVKIRYYSVSNNGQERCHWWSDEWDDFCCNVDDGDVTHWQPLPQPPVEKE